MQSMDHPDAKKPADKNAGFLKNPLFRQTALIVQ